MFFDLLEQEAVCTCVGGDIEAPEPAETLEQCSEGDSSLLAPRVVENLKNNLKCRWLLPIQKYAIAVAAKGLDLVACAATGTGKTLAFLSPLVSKCLLHQQLFRPHFAGSHAQVRTYTLLN